MNYHIRHSQNIEVFSNWFYDYIFIYPKQYEWIDILPSAGQTKLSACTKHYLPLAGGISYSLSM